MTGVAGRGEVSGFRSARWLGALLGVSLLALSACGRSSHATTEGVPSAGGDSAGGSAGTAGSGVAGSGTVGGSENGGGSAGSAGDSGSSAGGDSAGGNSGVAGTASSDAGSSGASGSAGSGDAGASGGSGAGNAGAAGSGSTVVDQIITSNLDKIDLLFMIDNSTSMADKQIILAQAVPQMVSRLITPLCVDPDTQKPVGGNATNGSCVNGQPEFLPVRDIHIAIVTSSLGSHGGDVCNTSVNADDLGQALGSVRTGLPSWNNTGFLAWDPGMDRNTPETGVETTASSLITDFSNMVQAVGEVGCGYEASLEAWYRFLIDPEPPLSVTQVGGVSQKTGINQTVLAQRKAFLRPDSLLAVIMLSDENDCSIIDSGYGWFVATRSLSSGGENRMYRSTSACSTDPNSPCCMSCGDSSTPPAQCGFSSAATEANCLTNSGVLTPLEDSVSLRCWEQKRRFGFDLLYPTQRYVNGLTSPSICSDSQDPTLKGVSCASPSVNPLFDPNINGPRADIEARDPSLVFLSGIVGVPWQDLATTDTLSDPNKLSYLSADDLEASGRWNVILGDPSASPPVPPSDPFMVETYVDRSTLPIGQKNPITNDPIVAHTSTNPRANAINGHEQNVVNVDDLQYACIFPLQPPTTCLNGQQACDCSPTAAGDLTSVTAYNSPLCQPPAGGAAAGVQNFAKGYPGLRFLKVLHDFGSNAIPASICPKIVDNQNPDFGYNPAVAAILNRLKVALRGRCLPRALVEQPVNPNDPSQGTQVPCSVVEATPSGGAACGACVAADGRAPVAASLVATLQTNMQSAGQCGVSGAPDCSAFCYCQILQEQGAASAACRKDPVTAASNASVPPGFCYISGSSIGASCSSDSACSTGTCSNNSCVESAALAQCPSSQRHLLGFVSGTGAGGKTVRTPAKGAVTMLACGN